MISQRTFIALACAALLGACGTDGQGDGAGGADTTAVESAPAAPATAPVTTDTGMAGHNMAGDSMMHDSMKHDTMRHDTVK